MVSFGAGQLAAYGWQIAQKERTHAQLAEAAAKESESKALASAAEAREAEAKSKESEAKAKMSEARAKESEEDAIAQTNTTRLVSALLGVVAVAILAYVIRVLLRTKR